MSKIEIGTYVKIKDCPETALMPKNMKSHAQRVVDKRDRERLVERWHSGRQEFVKAWVPLKALRVVPTPENVCLISETNTPNSGDDAYSRQHCLICSLKSTCPYYQQNHGDK